MQAIITHWLIEQGLNANYILFCSALIGSLLIILICCISFYVTKNYLLVVIHKVISASKNTWDDLLFEHQVFSRVALLVPFILLLFITPILVLSNLT